MEVELQRTKFNFFSKNINFDRKFNRICIGVILSSILLLSYSFLSINKTSEVTDWVSKSSSSISISERVELVNYFVNIYPKKSMSEIKKDLSRYDTDIDIDIDEGSPKAGFINAGDLKIFFTITEKDWSVNFINLSLKDAAMLQKNLEFSSTDYKSSALLYNDFISIRAYGNTLQIKQVPPPVAQLPPFIVPLNQTQLKELRVLRDKYNAESVNGGFERANNKKIEAAHNLRLDIDEMKLKNLLLDEKLKSDVIKGYQ